MPTVHETDQESLRRIDDRQYSVLIVDDMVNDRQLVRTALSNSDCRIVEAKDGEEALRCFIDQIIDVVLVVINQPGTSGFEVCKKIREIKELQGMPHVPVIMMVSDQDADAAINDGFNAGATDFVIQPFRPDELRIRFAVAVERIRLNEQLASARHTAESALRSQTALITMMSQEIRAPVNALIGLSYLGLQARLDKTPRNYLEKINFSARSLLSIINDALDFSRMEGGKLRLSEDDFNVHECLAQVHDLASDYARDKGLGFKLDISQEVPEVLCGDAARLGQVLINLVHTVVKLTEKGAAALHARVNAVDSDFVELLFIVRGGGINLQHIERLDNWNRHADHATGLRHSNSTLSLAISCELIDMMQGRIWAERSSDWNSALHCTVRLKHGHQMVNAGAAPTEQIESAKARINGARILIIEDNPTDQLVMRDLLELAGAVVDVASKKDRDAMDRLALDRFDVAIVNPRSDTMNNAERVRRIREKNKYGQLRMIGIINHISPEERDRSVLASMDDYLAWPVDPELMYRTLAKWLAGKSKISIHEHPEDAQSDRSLPVDISVLHQMFHNNATLVRKFGLKFVEVANDTLVEMNIAQSEKDLPALGRLGHKLKSSARTIGASSFADLCEKLEKANLNNNWSNAESLLKQIPVLLTQITQQLEQEFRTMDK